MCYLFHCLGKMPSLYHQQRLFGYCKYVGILLVKIHALPLGIKQQTQLSETEGLLNNISNKH